MANPSPRPESLLTALPTELSQSLFAKARPLSLKADQTLFMAGGEGDGCYRGEEGLLKARIAAPAGGGGVFGIFGPRAGVGGVFLIVCGAAWGSSHAPPRFKPWIRGAGRG